MMLDIKTFDIAGPIIITAKRLEDSRGVFCETYNSRAFAEVGVVANFIQDNYSLSRERGTVRGLHFQAPPHAQEKLVRVVRGGVLDVVLDLRKQSPTYGGHIALELNASDGQQLYIPTGFAHGFCTTMPDTEVAYKVTDFWVPGCEGGVLWNDPALDIAWPAFAGTQIAVRDNGLPLLRDLKTPYVFPASEPA